MHWHGTMWFCLSSVFHRICDSVFFCPPVPMAESSQLTVWNKFAREKKIWFCLSSVFMGSVALPFLSVHAVFTNESLDSVCTWNKLGLLHSLSVCCGWDFFESGLFFSVRPVYALWALYESLQMTVGNKWARENELVWVCFLVLVCINACKIYAWSLSACPSRIWTIFVTSCYATSKYEPRSLSLSLCCLHTLCRQHR